MLEADAEGDDSTDDVVVVEETDTPDEEAAPEAVVVAEEESSDEAAGDAHRLLRPVVSDLVDEWLRATHGIDLRHPDAARLVPNELWDIARPDLPRPENPHAPGPATVEVAGIIEQLERLP